MNEIELYEFDRQGYIVIRDFLRPAEVNSLQADFSKAENELEWSPRIRLDEGIKRTLKWYQNNCKYIF